MSDKQAVLCGALQVGDGGTSQGQMGRSVAAGRWLQLHGAPGQRGVGEWTQGKPNSRWLEVRPARCSGAPRGRGHTLGSCQTNSWAFAESLYPSSEPVNCTF